MITNEQTATLNELRRDCAKQQKKGLHFILASVFIWAAILIVHLTNLPIETKNILTFCVACPLMPLAWMISKLIHVDFQGKSNPLTSLGLLFSVNQILYILIAMWVFAAVPEKMLMVYSMIFGAHLMPYSWLYQSKSYMVMSIVVPILALVIGLIAQPYVLASSMLSMEVVFSFSLMMENKEQA
ncbi:MAG: hypothetical protein K6E67_11820 [Prevotella sp.]|jgi:hypothetical protein|nr:hypothetical protein [Prevotella sp.]